MNSINQRTLIFDLDGTLLDSSASILIGFSAALETHNLKPQQALTSTLIGPPLRSALSGLAGSDDPVLLDSLCASFKVYYDTEGYKATKVFPGVDDLLKRARGNGIPLHIATNKRLVPTRLILDYLGWSDLFISIYTPDIRSPSFSDKAAMLAELIEEQGIAHRSAAYVGDRPEDGYAADKNNLTFYAAVWGYEAIPHDSMLGHWIRATNPDEIFAD